MREQLLLYRQRLLERFSSVGEELRRATQEMPPERWHVAAAIGNTPHHMLAYLRAREIQKNSVRLRRILEEVEPFLPLFDDDRWLEEDYDPDEPAGDILAEFIALRSEVSGWLRDLSPEDWNRTARHPWWGVRSLQWWVEQTMHTTEEQVRQLKSALSQ